MIWHTYIKAHCMDNHAWRLVSFLHTNACVLEVNYYVVKYFSFIITICHCQTVGVSQNQESITPVLFTACECTNPMPFFHKSGRVTP